MICVHCCVHCSGVYTVLTDTKLRKSLGKRREKVEVLSDSNGLNVRLSITGGVTFFYRYRWQGKPVQLSIGDYPAISLVMARERRQQFRTWISEGYDPRQKVRVESDPTPKSCSIQKQNSGMINTPLNGGGADEKATIHRRADCLCPEAC